MSSKRKADGDTEEQLNITSEPPLSKKQMKKLKRQQAWEDRRDERKAKRKEKRHDQQARKRVEKQAKIAEAVAAGLDPEYVIKAETPAPRQRWLVPVTIILDCDFEKYMHEGELVSLAGQITRSYSQNRNGLYQAHLYASSWKGFLRHRFETVFGNQHQKWQNFHAIEGDYLEAAREAHDLMKGEEGGKLNDALRGEHSSKFCQQRFDSTEADASQQLQPRGETRDMPENTEQHQQPPAEASVVYLTSESTTTLDKLEPYTSYVIGGIVDKNREKGLCYKLALERGLRTAKLPIGEYMQMQSRQVLTTNQVVEIMSKWLETGDWGTAFMAVIPKRKGGQLRGQTSENETGVTEADGKEEHDEAASKAEKGSLPEESQGHGSLVHESPVG